ncbi:RNA methyltransferase [Candidatus Marinamargulisbacteria bacterium SCGC AAA071-K20]|nr:RNA methyltransferase [Candidatus Marinamargulisbacteria bacterium SCGC AAA071-K20]
MPADDGLVERIRAYFNDYPNINEKKMFGGVCFMLNGNMICGVDSYHLMLRVGKDQYEECLERPNATKMDFTGKPLKGFIYVDQDGIAEDEELEEWIRTAEAFVGELPPK